MRDLGTLSGSITSSAVGINNSGQIVGLSTFEGGVTRAFLYSGGAMRGLTDLIPANTLPPGAVLAEALGINSSGQIIANSANNFHGYLLTPVAPPLSIASPASLPPGIVGAPYGPIPFVATGGTSERDWAANGLPPGLFINAATGALGGTPAPGSEGVYPNAKFTVIDSNGAVASVTLSLTINPAGSTVPPPPVITSVSPNPVLGTGLNQQFCVNGSGFVNGAGLMVRLTWPTAQVDLPVSFFNPSQLCLTFNFGIAPGNWTAQVVSGDGQLSNIFFFTVAAPGHGSNTHLALPHFVFGGSWYSAILLSNTTGALESVPIRFRDDAGAPLLAPLADIGSVSSRIVVLNPGTTVLVEALNGPMPLTEGWADISLPPGVIGYGITREVTDGRVDHEALIPFIPESSQAAEFTYDDTSFTTAVGLVNPGNQQTTVTITAFGADGDQVGSTQLPLAPGAKSVNTLRAYAGMAGVAGKQGRVVVSVPNGAVSVLALRFGAAGFSNIPVNHR
jgi:probable HAF family extracellular repeat protein